MERLKLEMENMKQDKQREINRLEQTAQQTMVENRQLKDDVRDKEEVCSDHYIFKYILQPKIYSDRAGGIK